jgi:hypothetical protein
MDSRLERGPKLALKVCVQVFQPAQDVHFLGRFGAVVILIKHLNKKTPQHVDVNLTTFFHATPQGNTLCLQQINLLQQGKITEQKTVEHGSLVYTGYSARTKPPHKNPEIHLHSRFGESPYSLFGKTFPQLLLISLMDRHADAKFLLKSFAG